MNAEGKIKKQDMTKPAIQLLKNQIHQDVYELLSSETICSHEQLCNLTDTVIRTVMRHVRELVN